MGYSGNSIVDYLKSTGQASDYASRSKLAAEKGISDYKGTAEQNLSLLNTLRGSGGSAPAASSPTPTSSGRISSSTSSSKQYGGWYNNDSAGGKNQRYWGTDASGNEIWTDGQEPGLPTIKEEVTPYLNNYQNNIFSDSNAPTTSIPTPDELKKQLAPETGLPDLLNRAESFETLRTKYGVSELETSLADLKAQEEEAIAAFKTQKYGEEGKPVALNVISGRVSEEERAAQERLDFIGRQKSRVVDELNTKYNIIGQLMEFESLDYQDAVTRYQDEFTRNVQIYELISGEKQAARSAFESDRAAASANLNIYMNAITAGNLDYGSLSGEQKNTITKLEVQAGLPVGFMSSLKRDPGSDIVFTTSNNGVTQVGIRNTDGSISVQSYGTPTGGGGGTADERANSATIKRFNSDITSINPINTGGGTIGIFPQLVARYASELELSEIYSLYNNSSVAQEYGAPGEDPQDIRDIYDKYR